MATTVARADEIDAISAWIAAGQSVLLTGAAGVGKSHLAAVIATRFGHDGWRVVRLSGGPAMKTVHLGAAQPLLSPSMARTPDELFANVEAELRTQAGSMSTLLVVDDINQIDSTSAALLRQLGSAGITLLATVRDEGAADPFVLALWTDGLLERLDIGALTASESANLIDQLLPGGTGPSVHASVFALTAGNPLFTRELIADARHSGALVENAGTWRIERALRAEHRVSDLFAARLTGLTADQREALESIALAEPLPVAVAIAVSAESVVEQLQSLGLVKVTDSQVRCSHPMLGEVTRRDAPSLRTDRLVRQLITAILSSPDSSANDVLRAVRWQLQRGEAPDVQVAAAAAQTALSIFDGATAVQCAQAALTPDSAMAHALLGRAQFISQDLDGAIATLQRGCELATSDAERAVTAVGLCEAIAFGTGDFAAASTVVEQAMETITDAPHRAMVAGSLSLVRGLVGDFAPALRYGAELLDSPDIDAMARLNLSLMWTVAAASTGRLGDTQHRLAIALELAYELQPLMPAAPDQILAAQFLFDSTDGRIDEAIALAVEQREVSERDRRFSALWDTCIAQGDLLAGRGASAVEHADRAAAAVVTSDPIGIAPLVLAGQAMAAASVGDLPAALRAHDASIADPRCGPREQPFLALASAAVLALQGDTDAAVAEVKRGAAEAGDALVWAGWALYDGVRFNRAAAVADELGVIAARAPVEMLLAMNDHCEALVAGDAALLTKACERLVLAGHTLFGAEAAAHAAQQLGIDGDATGAAFMALRSLALFDRCDSVRSLAVESLEQPLTGRELEIVRAAASGRPSQAIADELFVSRRTVDNHLQNAYRKLGINQRDELTHVFAINGS